MSLKYFVQLRLLAKNTNLYGYSNTDTIELMINRSYIYNLVEAFL